MNYTRFVNIRREIHAKTTMILTSLYRTILFS